MSDGYERPISLAAAPLEFVAFEDSALPLTVAPCAVASLLRRFPSYPEGS